MISVTMGEPVARRASLSRSRPSLRYPERSRERCGGLKGAAAQQGSARRLYPLGAVGDLLLALNAARPCDDCKVAAADLDASTLITLSSGWNLRLAFL